MDDRYTVEALRLPIHGALRGMNSATTSRHATPEILVAPTDDHDKDQKGMHEIFRQARLRHPGVQVGSCLLD